MRNKYFEDWYDKYVLMFIFIVVLGCVIFGVFVIMEDNNFCRDIGYKSSSLQDAGVVCVKLGNYSYSEGGYKREYSKPIKELKVKVKE